MDSPWLNTLCDMLNTAGVTTARFNFPYMEIAQQTGKKRPPNPTPKLLESWQNTLSHSDIANYNGDVYIGGKSMGGRMATMVCADVETAPRPFSFVKGCICYGYPFHPPAKPEKIRTAHLGQSYTTPTLICQGERDTFGTYEQVTQYPLSPTIKLAWLPHSNHDLKPLKSTGKTQNQMLQTAVQHTAEFMGIK